MSLPDYEQFLLRRQQSSQDYGFDPTWMPDKLFPFQIALTEWAIKKGRAAIFADCGMGKTACQLTWAENVARHTGKKVLILTPLAVGPQTVREGEKFGIECIQSRDGKIPTQITITNYEQLHKFRADDFIGCVCDESSIIKHNTGATQKAVTRFMNKMPYRLLCTATAAPNDFVELGTSSEALGELSYSEMLTRFFRQRDNKGQLQESRNQEFARMAVNHYARLSFRVHQSIGQWRLKYHAVQRFWQWVSSWSRACRMPSDLGFEDDGFILPPLKEIDHIIKPDSLPEGFLFSVPAFGLREEREERKRTINQRCEYVANLVDHDQPAVVWCHYNQEGKLLTKLIPDAREVAGSTPDDEKEEIYEDFLSGKLRVIVSKPKIGAWGLNWQHCAHGVTFASHSYEQSYQSLRRIYRFGQKKPVRWDVVATEGERRVIDNMRRKANQADEMFERMMTHMTSALRIKRTEYKHKTVELPDWVKE